MNRRNIAIVAALVMIAAIFFAMRHSRTTAAKREARVAPETDRDSVQGRGPAAAPALTAALTGAGTNEPLPGERAELIAHLRDQYGKHIHSSYVQMKMLEALMRHLQANYPDRWREILLDIVREAFPEFYDSIAALLEHRLDYEAWMEENRDRLQGMSKEERRAAMWEARNRLFGEDAAAQIWAAEIKNRAIGDALLAIDAHEGASIADKLDMYRKSLDDIHGEAAERFLQNHRHEAMNRFIGLDSVQSQLASMSAGERSASLRAIRKGMGLDDAALARWDELDRKRDERWEAGRAYMTERDAVVKQYTGAELENRLDALRARYFGAEAEVIASEEQAGFFRFSRPRRWGQN